MSKRTRKAVSEDEMNAFVQSYPHELALDVCGIGDPPLVSFNDERLGAWPDSIVASYLLPYDPAKDAKSNFAIFVNPQEGKA